MNGDDVRDFGVAVYSNHNAGETLSKLMERSIRGPDDQNHLLTRLYSKISGFVFITVHFLEVPPETLERARHEDDYWWDSNSAEED